MRFAILLVHNFLNFLWIGFERGMVAIFHVCRLLVCRNLDFELVRATRAIYTFNGHIIIVGDQPLDFGEGLFNVTMFCSQFSLGNTDNECRVKIIMYESCRKLLDTRLWNFCLGIVSVSYFT